MGFGQQPVIYSLHIVDGALVPMFLKWVLRRAYCGQVFEGWAVVKGTWMGLNVEVNPIA
jgi:hypothetical protein